MSCSLHESWEQYRQRLLAKTSRFIEWGLRHPELGVWIPAKPVGQGGFPRAVADWFWGMALLADRGWLERWREKFLWMRRFLPGG